MRISLIKPCWSFPIGRSESIYNRIWPPLSLINCAALLRKSGHDPLIIDAAARQLSPKEVAKLADGSEMVVVTSTSLDRWQCPNIDIEPFLSVIAELRSNGMSPYICGTHGTVRPQEILELSKAHGVIRGEPEEVLVNLAKSGSPAGVKGMTYLKDGEIIHEPPCQGVVLTDLPLPAFDLLDFSKYSYEVLGKNFALIETSRGCPYGCTFCVKATYGPDCRYKNPDQVIREIDDLLSRGVKSAYFFDLEFTLNRKMVEAICTHLKSLGSPWDWCCQTRADAVDEPLLNNMKEAGCRIVHFGVETGSKRLADTLGKNVSFQEIRHGVKLTQRAGIESVCFFMFGLPTETEKEALETIRFARELSPTYASFHIAQPYPGTMFHDQVKESLGDELFPEAYTGVISKKKLLSLTRRAFLTFYLRPGYLASRLKSREFGTLFRQAGFFLRYLWHRLGIFTKDG